MQELTVPPIDEGARAAAEVALGEFSGAAARDDGAGVVAAGLRLARAGGFGGLLDVMERSRHGGTEELNRQWYWLLAVARYAAERGDTQTAVLAFMFADVWRLQISPRHGLGELDDIGFPPPPEPLQADLAALAMAFLVDQDLNRIVTEGPAATITVRVVLFMAASRVVELAESGIDITPSLVNGARQIVRGLAG
ncbi:hypothetical protein ACQP00_11790 [Dactylosporangium sp. CS-047395]|uniref:hypothetical protein n=1 Tax=Dactylosporangium sp. CS-047395 TaxID=3239936 RepID=UPI003D91C4C7